MPKEGVWVNDKLTTLAILHKQIKSKSNLISLYIFVIILTAMMLIVGELLHCFTTYAQSNATPIYTYTTHKQHTSCKTQSMCPIQSFSVCVPLTGPTYLQYISTARGSEKLT